VALPWAAHAETLPCDPWPGEPSPLPRVTDADPVLARWAGLRADELAALAIPLEAVAASDAHRLWRHVACLDPGSAAARDGVERTAVARVHQPPVRLEARRRSEDERSGDLRAALEALREPILVPPAAAAARVARRDAAPARTAPAEDARGPAPRRDAAPDFRAVDTALGQADALLREARYEEALARVEQARSQLPRGEGAAARRARLESVAATAQFALGRDAEARRSFGAALEADPQFRLDSQRTSPKVMRAFDAARSAQGPPEGGSATAEAPR